MGDPGEGRRGVIGDAVAAASAALGERRDAAAGEQLPMFPVPTRHTGARAEHLQRALEDQRRRAGRPPGARNRSTAIMREYLLGRGADPLQRLAEWGLHTPTSLAAELGCTRLEAFRELRAVWEAAAPFLYGKVAPIDPGTGQAVPFLQVNFPGAGGPSGNDPPWLYLQQNQPLSLAPDPASHAARSHDEAK